MTVSQLEVNTIDLNYLLKKLKDKKWFILGVGITFSILAMSYSFLSAPQYQTSILLQIQQKTSVNLNSSSQSHSSSDNTLNEPIATQIALIRSKVILGPVIDSLALNKHLSKHEAMQSLLSHLKLNYLTSDSDNQLNHVGIFELSLTGTNPILIAQTLNQIAHTLIQRNIERKSLLAEKSILFLTQELPIVKKSLQLSEEKLAQYRAMTHHTDIQLQHDALMNHLTNINKQLQDLREKKTNLLQSYTEHYPFVISITKKIQMLEQQRMVIYHDLKKLPTIDQTTVAINREITVNNNLYMDLLKKIHELEVIKAGMISDVQLLSPADIPHTALSSHISLIGIISFMVGAGLASLIMLGRLSHGEVIPFYKKQQTTKYADEGG